MDRFEDQEVLDLGRKETLGSQVYVLGVDLMQCRSKHYGEFVEDACLMQCCAVE